MTRKRTFLTLAPRLLAAAGALVLSTSALAGQPLFVGQANPAAEGARTAARLTAKADTAGLRVVKANPDVVSARTGEIELDLGGRRVNLMLEKTSATPTGSLVWTGHVRETAPLRAMTAREVKHDANNSAILVRRGQGVTGSVRVDGKLFRIRPIAGGQHAVIEVDETRMPAEHPVQFNRIPQVRMAAREARPSKAGTVGALAIDPGPTATIRVMVVATNDAIAAYGGDMQALVELAVAESNQGYVNSNVGINMELASYTTTSYATAGMSTDLSRFRSTSDGIMDTIHATRDASAADVAMLVANDSSSCGLASSIGSTAATAFATAYWDCITGYYSFAHEIGHLQSARHDPATDGSTSPYTYGHGYRAPNNAWRTIMAYNCSPSCPRINYWSNPDVTYSGQAMGTTDTSHNQRVLVNTKATVAAYRGGVANAAPTANFTSSTSNLTASFTDTSTDTDGTIVSRASNFGDGATSTATNPSRTYAAAGTYTVTLTVTDDDGATNTKTASVTVSNSNVQTYTNSADYTINDNATVSSPIVVSGRTGNGLSSTQVTVNILHTYIGDLKVDLVAPDGSVYVLHNRAGGSADNINKTYTINLSSEALNGTWNLRVNDNASADTGRIDSWSIRF
ncbi:proprotein convertase P-domain-containing protein [Lysobacter solisilvae]|uniref:Proprotein convertase P-domain-containing protein n=1 Tax=Agrilutibacter solisilvae TaxID=2763317 RepID=A0A975AU20_9GAMM|nr:proprotein convertase P-domain-containing protein [Lysobacter solisilvae]QSX79809.1 proprotein convertase P-domain-containing protein [Lysobacter solisilvae]